MQQENNVKYTKDVFKGLGAGKTDQSLVRSSAAAPIVGTIVKHYERLLGIHQQSGYHTAKSNEEDVLALLDQMKRDKPFLSAGKETGKYKIGEKTYNFDPDEYHNYLARTVRRLSFMPI